MAVTAAPAGQVSKTRGFQAGELAAAMAGVNLDPAPSVAKELPLLLIRRALQSRSREPC
jgi:hypothetical protein